MLSDIEEAVEEARKPGVFKITDVVRDRAFPESFVDIYLDESIAYIISQLDESLQELSNSADKKKILTKKEIEAFEKKRDDIVKKKNKLVEDMGGAKYVFHFKGISEGRRQDIYDQTLEKFPMKYEKNRNPYTGKLEKDEIEDVNRDRYFSDMLWQAHILKIESPSGDQQVGITLEEAVELRRSLPAASVSKISESIEKLRVASAAFMLSMNEDFLAKS